MDMPHRLCLKWGNKALLQTQGTLLSINTWQAGWEESEKGSILLDMSPFAVQLLRLSRQHRSSAVLQHKIKSFKTQMRLCNAPKGHTEPGLNLVFSHVSDLRYASSAAVITVCLPPDTVHPSSLAITPDTALLTRASCHHHNPKGFPAFTAANPAIMGSGFISQRQTHTKDEKAQHCVCHTNSHS